MATQASVNKKRAKELAAINKKLDDILSILTAPMKPKQRKTIGKKA